MVIQGRRERVAFGVAFLCNSFKREEPLVFVNPWRSLFIYFFGKFFVLAENFFGKLIVFVCVEMASYANILEMTYISMINRYLVFDWFGSIFCVVQVLHMQNNGSIHTSCGLIEAQNWPRNRHLSHWIETSDTQRCGFERRPFR